MRRLDPNRPVSDADITTIVEAAACAPSGGNLQPLQWIVVRDPRLRAGLGDIYRRVSTAITDSSTTEKRTPIERSIAHLAEHMGEAPVLLVAAAAGEPDLRLAASVYPAVQNLMLAARSLGLGTTLTMRHRIAEPEVQSLLGIPARVHIFCVIPVGYPLGRWARRRGMRQPVIHRDRFDDTKAPP